MAKIKNKNSFSSFHFVLNRFKINSFSKNWNYFFFLFCFFVLISQSPFCYVSSLQIGSSGFGTLHFITGRTRFSRSPFMPPTVTSFKPSVRTSPQKPESYGRINQSKVAVLPPFVLSQSAPMNKSRKNEERNSHVPMSPGKSLFPRPPMIVQFSRQQLINDDNINTVKDEELTIIPQNDQHPIAAGTEMDEAPTLNKSIEEEKKEAEEMVLQKDSAEKHIPSYNSFVKVTKEKDLKGFHEVLDALDITVDELQLILKKINISLDQFLSFIDSEKSKEEIIKFLNLPQSLKNSDYRNEEYTTGHKMEKSVPYSVDRQKVLVDHLPFTEIVHDVPLRTQSYKETSFNSDKSVTVDFRQKDKGGKKIYDDEVNEKKIKSKRIQQKTEDVNPFLMNSAFSTMLPPRDSPIIMPFLPPQRKPTKPPTKQPPKGTASIISLSIEEKVINHQTTKVPNEQLPIRNKVISHVDEHYKYAPKSDQRSWTKSAYDQQQANLRLVFPMKGILMFCGILGVVAIITIIILIIYGAIKCNQKPTSSTYELNEHQECSGSTTTT